MRVLIIDNGQRDMREDMKCQVAMLVKRGRGDPRRALT